MESRRKESSVVNIEVSEKTSLKHVPRDTRMEGAVCCISQTQQYLQPIKFLRDAFKYLKQSLLRTLSLCLLCLLLAILG